MYAYLHKDAARCKHSIWCKRLCIKHSVCVIIVTYVVMWFYANTPPQVVQHTCLWVQGANRL